MNWAEYVKTALKSSDYINRLSLRYEDEFGQYEIPPISFISNLVVNKLINNSNSANIIIMPERGTLALFTVIYKLILSMGK